MRDESNATAKPDAGAPNELGGSSATASTDGSLEARGSIGSADGGPRNRSVDVFISYRVSPDESLAGALKKLLETSIEPTPSVFVSGLGGIKPSNVGAIPQMQAAAESARAFIGIITKASKDREWIYFEAGAAWGRRCLYAPLLIDCDFADLPNTIEGYQATVATDRERVRLLVGSLANAVGGSVRGHFTQRYNAFERAIREYPENSPNGSADAPEKAEVVDPSSRVYSLLAARQYDEAMAEFDRLELVAKDEPLELAKVKTSRIFFDDRLADSARLNALEAIALECAMSPTYHYRLAELEPIPHRRISHLRTCLAASPGDALATDATTTLASILRQVGREREALDVLRNAMSTGSRARKASCASELLRFLELGPSVERVLLACYCAALSSAPEHTLECGEAATLALAVAPQALAVHLARRVSRVAPDGSSANTEGTVYTAVGLRSLAFLAYERAVAEGVTVAKANMASILGSHPVPAAGLDILTRHTGGFDALYPQHPHRVRASLEEAMQRERERADKLEHAGQQVFAVLTEVIDRAAATQQTRHVPRERYSQGGKTFGMHHAEEDASIMLRNEASGDAFIGSFSPMRCIYNLWYHTNGDKDLALLTVDEGGSAVIARIKNDGDGADIEWTSLLPLPSEEVPTAQMPYLSESTEPRSG